MNMLLADLLKEYPVKTVWHSLKLLPSLHYHNAGALYRKLFPRKAQVILYTNNACNSRCIHCNHWSQRPIHFLSYNIIKSVFNSPSVDRDGFLLEGGEILLHPELDKILSLFGGRDFTFLSNGILVDRLVEIVKKHSIPQVVMSLDGDREAYKKIRGVDQYEHVITAARRLKKITQVGLCFTQTPWNNTKHYMHVKQICEKQGYRFLFNIFSNMHYMGKGEYKLDPIDTFYDTDESVYARSYNPWTRGEVKIPCLYMRTSCVIHPNGDVVLCQWKDDKLGNLYERSFEEIWNDPATIELQKNNLSCTKCWVSSHKAFDIKLVHLLDKVFPKPVVRKMIGEYTLPRGL